MKISVLFFGITADITKTKMLGLKLATNSSVLNFKEVIFERYPELKKNIQFVIAVNEEYAEDSLILKNNDVVAVIPPVSGG